MTEDTGAASYCSSNNSWGLFSVLPQAQVCLEGIKGPSRCGMGVSLSTAGKRCQGLTPPLPAFAAPSQNDAAMKEERMCATGGACFYKCNVRTHRAIFMHHEKVTVPTSRYGSLGGRKGTS